MLIFSQAKVTVDWAGNVKVEGALEPYRSRIYRFVHDEGIRDTSIRLRSGQLRISGYVKPDTRQKVEKFLTVECPVS